MAYILKSLFIPLNRTLSVKEISSQNLREVKMGTREILGALEMLYFLIMVVVTWVYTFVKTWKHTIKLDAFYYMQIKPQ